MSDVPKILAFSGSLRKDSLNKKVVQVAAEGARKAGAEVTIFDLNELPLPLYNSDLQEAEGFPENAAKLQQVLLAHHGLLIASPEYNGSLPAALKNVFDWASRANGEVKMGAAFKGKIAGIMSASPGSFGGIRCLSHLRSILTIMGVIVLPDEFAVSSAHEAFDENGIHKDAKMHSLLEKHGANVVELIKKIKS